MMESAYNQWSTWMSIMSGTLLSEDLTCIAVGLLVREQGLGLITGIGACFAGIYLGDLGLWLIGRVMGRRLLRMRWLAARVPEHRLNRLGRWIDTQGWRVIVASRFLPGTRLPLYVASGMLGRNAIQFVFWSFVAAAVWTPLLVGSVMLLGSGIVEPLEALLGVGWLALAIAAILLFVLVRLVIALTTRQGRDRLAVRLQRWRRYEFWPAWLFYAPLAPYYLWLTIRYRGPTTFTAANPGIPHGGVVGESKFEILSRLPSEWIVPSALILAGRPSDRCHELRAMIQEQGWSYPLVFKPNAAQRGAGVKLVRDESASTNYFKGYLDDVLVQIYHPGPYEAGIFYYRMPDEPSGHIFSITDKVFPELVGDGRATIESLIRRHPRYRLQAKVYLARHAARLNDVLYDGEHFRLALAGNHCQGTLFRDGAHLITPELESRVDRIARQCDGFYIGRFDVRYSDVEAFRAGRDLAIIELNGVTSESTNIYDPSWSILTAYRTLIQQWELTFRIGLINRKHGHHHTTAFQLIRSIRSYYRCHPIKMLAD